MKNINHFLSRSGKLLSLAVLMIVFISSSCTQRRYGHMKFRNNLNNPFKKEQTVVQSERMEVDRVRSAEPIGNSDLLKQKNKQEQEQEREDAISSVSKRFGKTKVAKVLDALGEQAPIAEGIENLSDKIAVEKKVERALSELKEKRPLYSVSPESLTEDNEMSTEDLVYLILVVILILLIIALLKEILGPLWGILILALLIVLLGMLLGLW